MSARASMRSMEATINLCSSALKQHSQGEDGVRVFNAEKQSGREAEILLNVVG